MSPSPSLDALPDFLPLSRWVCVLESMLGTKAREGPRSSLKHVNLGRCDLPFPSRASPHLPDVSPADSPVQTLLRPIGSGTLLALGCARPTPTSVPLPVLPPPPAALTPRLHTPDSHPPSLSSNVTSAHVSRCPVLSSRHSLLHYWFFFPPNIYLIPLLYQVAFSAPCIFISCVFSDLHVS